MADNRYSWPANFSEYSASTQKTIKAAIQKVQLAVRYREDMAAKSEQQRADELAKRQAYMSIVLKQKEKLKKVNSFYCRSNVVEQIYPGKYSMYD